MAKRTVQVNVKMSEEDFALLKKAAAAHWPDAVITKKSRCCSLAGRGDHQFRDRAGVSENRGQDCFGGEQASIN